MNKKFFAHIRKSDGAKEPIEEHLRRTSELSSYYMKDLGLENFGQIVGYFHDIGKHTEAFQNILRRKEQKVNHAIPGAALLINKYNYLIEDTHLRRIAFDLISSHHAGLGSEFVKDIYIDEDDFSSETVPMASDVLECDSSLIVDGKRNAHIGRPSKCRRPLVRACIEIKNVLRKFSSCFLSIFTMKKTSQNPFSSKNLTYYI